MSIREIARITAIAPATIARFIKDPNSIKESTKLKIYQALEKEKKLHLIKKSLVRKIVVVIPELRNTFYSDLCSGVIDCAQKKSIPCEIFLSHEDENKELNIFQQIKDYHNTGIIWAPTSNTVSIPTFEKSILLNIDRDIQNSQMTLKVLCDNIKATEKATELMLKKGVKNPILITGNKNLTNAQDRAQGFKNILEQNNFRDISERIFYGDFNDSTINFAIANKFLRKTKYDGILAGNHIIASGIIRALNKNNLSIPKDIFLTTFDHLPGEGILDYSINEVVFPGYDMGKEAVSILLQQQFYKTGNQITKFSADFFIRD